MQIVSPGTLSRVVFPLDVQLGRGRNMVLLCCALLAWPLGASGQQLRSRSALRGLNSVSVQTSLTGCDSVLAPSREHIQTVAELRLRQSRIRVLSERDTLPDRGGGVLRVSIVCLGTHMQSTGRLVGFAFALNLDLLQFVQIVANGGTFAAAVTWQDATDLRTGPSDALTRVVGESLEDSIIEFLNDYLAANPGK